MSSGTGRAGLLGAEDFCSAVTLLLQSRWCCGGTLYGRQDKMLPSSYIKKKRNSVLLFC